MHTGRLFWFDVTTHPSPAAICSHSIVRVYYPLPPPHLHAPPVSRAPRALPLPAGTVVLRSAAPAGVTLRTQRCLTVFIAAVPFRLVLLSPAQADGRTTLLLGLPLVPRLVLACRFCRCSAVLKFAAYPRWFFYGLPWLVALQPPALFCCATTPVLLQTRGWLLLNVGWTGTSYRQRVLLHCYPHHTHPPRPGYFTCCILLPIPAPLGFPPFILYCTLLYVLRWTAGSLTTDRLVRTFVLVPFYIPAAVRCQLLFVPFTCPHLTSALPFRMREGQYSTCTVRFCLLYSRHFIHRFRLGFAFDATVFPTGQLPCVSRFRRF